MNTEDRLRRALSQRAEDLDVTPPPWSVLQQRARRATVRRRAAVGVAGVVALTGGLTLAGLNSGATRHVTTVPAHETTGGGVSRPTAEPPTSAPAKGAATSFGSTTPVSVSPSGHSQLTSVDVAHHDGFDRVVFRFGTAGAGPPGYAVSFATGPLYRDGSGAPVTVNGSAAIVVKIVYATGFGTYHGPTTITPGLPAVVQLTQTGDFEGYLTWAIGLQAQAPFTVSTLRGPDRLVIDIATH
jgi:hypothetical protein